MMKRKEMKFKLHKYLAPLLSTVMVLTSVPVYAATLTKDTDYTVEYSNNTNAGTGTVTIKGKGNYKGSKTVSFNITKADAVVIPPTANTLTCSEEEQTLIIQGASTTGTIKYKLGVDGTYSTELPKVSSAGTYTVYYKSFGDANHLDSEEGHIDVIYPAHKLTHKHITSCPREQVAYIHSASCYRYEYSNGSLVRQVLICTKTYEIRYHCSSTRNYCTTCEEFIKS